MLIFEKQKIVLYTSPRAGSSSVLHYAVTVGNAIHVAGPDRMGQVWGHYARPFQEFAHFKQVVIVRRPLERLCSLYRLHRQHEATIGLGEYIESLASGRFADKAIHDNQCTFLRNVKEDVVLHMHDGIGRQLTKLGLMAHGFRMDRKNKSPRREVPAPENISAGHVEMLRTWFEPDCKRFNLPTH